MLLGACRLPVTHSIKSVPRNSGWRAHIARSFAQSRVVTVQPCWTVSPLFQQVISTKPDLKEALKDVVETYETASKSQDLFRVEEKPGLCVINASPQYQGLTDGLHKLVPEALAKNLMAFSLPPRDAEPSIVMTCAHFPKGTPPAEFIYSDSFLSPEPVSLRGRAVLSAADPTFFQQNLHSYYNWLDPQPSSAATATATSASAAVQIPPELQPRSMKLAVQAAPLGSQASPLLVLRDKTYARGCISLLYPDSTLYSFRTLANVTVGNARHDIQPPHLSYDRSVFKHFFYPQVTATVHRIPKHSYPLLLPLYLHNSTILPHEEFILRYETARGSAAELLMLKNTIETGQCFGVIEKDNPSIGVAVGVTLIHLTEMPALFLVGLRRFKIVSTQTKPDSYGLKLATVKYIDDDKEDLAEMELLRDKLMFAVDRIILKKPPPPAHVIQKLFHPRRWTDPAGMDPAWCSWHYLALLNVPPDMRAQLMASSSVCYRLQQMYKWLKNETTKLSKYFDGE